jgi:hypothetical protein
LALEKPASLARSQPEVLPALRPLRLPSQPLVAASHAASLFQAVFRPEGAQRSPAWFFLWGREPSPARSTVQLRRHGPANGTATWAVWRQSSDTSICGCRYRAMNTSRPWDCQERSGNQSPMPTRCLRSKWIWRRRRRISCTAHSMVANQYSLAFIFLSEPDHDSIGLRRH